MAIDLDVHGNTKPLEAAVQAAINRIRRQPIKITVDDKGATQPLGNMKRAADEFSKSMEAANARILAFGASMAIINGVADAFKGMVRNLVQVEKSLADINVVMGLSNQNLEQFGDGLFKVAKETGAAFRVAADAATEYARQGLAVEETLKRTRDALVLTRLTGMDSAEAVKSLTAAMNTYGNQIKDTTQLVSKFAAVDVQFAVSAEDFAAAISRTGQAAKSAGVDIDELIGIVTSAQQQTARGGAVIGNALKTIFTKTGRTDTLNQLENLGIAVRDLEGNTIGAKRILTDLANTFDTLSEAQKAQITQTMGGLFHINILKAVLSDAAKQNGILANATQISANATDEAIQKNEQLRKTMDAMASETGNAIKQLSVQIGELMLAPGMEKILNTVKSLAEGASDILGDGESAGNQFANGFLKGLGNVITGPGLVVLTTVFVKLFMTAAKFTKESLSSLIGVTSEAQKQKAIQTSLVALIGQNAALGKEMLRTDISRTEKEKILLGLLKMQTAEAERLNAVSQKLASTLYTKGYGPGLTQGKRRAYGHIPNFADPERAQAAKGGYAAGSIRTMNMPGEGSVIYNSAETVKNFAGFKQPAIMPPQSSKAGKNYQQAFGSIHGFDPYAAGGFIPNFNKRSGKGLGKAPTPRNLQSKKLGTLNADSSLILLTADSSAADGENNWFVGQNPQGETKVYDSSELASKRTTGYYKVDVPYYSIDKKDKTQAGKEDLPAIQKAIRGAAVNKALDIATAIVGGKKNLRPYNKEQIEKTFNDGAFKAAAGSTFESAIAAALKSHLFQDYQARTDTSAIDLPYDPRLFGYFGAPNGYGKMGAEVKADLASKLQKGAANKFYQVLTGGRAAWEYKDKDYKDKTGGRAAYAGLERRGSGYFKKGKAYGHIPNFADPLSDAIGREKAAGVPVSQIRVGSHNALMSKSNPLGLGVTNTHDEPNGLRDVFGANGFVPNYAFDRADFVPRDVSSGRFRSTAKLAKRANRELSLLLNSWKEGKISNDQLSRGIKNLATKHNIHADSLTRVTKTTNESITTTERLTAARKRFTNHLGSGTSKFGGNTGMMMMIGAPMAAGYLQSGGAEQGGFAYNTGGAMQGAATGAMMTGMIAPFLGPAAPFVVAAGALYGAFDGWYDAIEENTKALKEKESRRLATQSQSASQTFSQIVQGEELTRDIQSAGLTSAIKAGFDPKMTVGQTLYQMGAQEEKAIGLDELFGPNWTKELPQFKNISEEDRARKEKTYRKTFAKMQKTYNLADYASGERTDPNYNLSNIDDDDIRGVSGFLSAMGYTNIQSLRQSLLSKGSERRQARGQAIDYFLDNEKADKFKFKFEEGGQDVLFAKDEYRKLLKGETAKDISGKERTAELSQINKKLTEQGVLEEEYNKTKTEQKQAIILQLNLQKAQIQAQKAAADAQLDIKSKFLEQSSLLDSQEKLLGGLMSEEQKVRIKYNKSLLKASEAYESGAAQARAALKEGILQDITQNTALQSALKQELFKGEDPSGKTLMDLTNKLSTKDAKELEAILKRIAETHTEANEILTNRGLIYDNQLNTLEKQQNLSNRQSQIERDINMKLAERKSLMEDINQAMQEYVSKLDYASKLRGISSDLQAARFGAGPARTQEEIFAEQQRLVGVRQQNIQTEFIKGGLSTMQSFGDKIGLTEEQRMQIIQDPSSLSDVTATAIKDKESKLQSYQTDKDTLRTIIDDKKSSGRNTQEEEFKLQEIISLEQSINDAKAEQKKESQRISEELERQVGLKNAQISKEQELLNIQKQEYARKTGPGAFSEGMKDARIEMGKQVKMMDYELGQKIPYAFADGMANAMTEALNGTKNIKDALTDAAISFLGMIQKAMMQKAAYSIVGAMGFSRGGNVRNYSRGGGVPAMVSNGEYVMGRDAVAKYGGSFMHSLNAGGKIPGFSGGGGVEADLLAQGKIRRESDYSGPGEAGSALAANFGGGRGFASGRQHQRRAMSGFFYAQSGNVGLGEDTAAIGSVLQEEERRRQEAEARRQAKKAKRRQLLGMVLGTIAAAGISSVMQGGNLTGTAKAAGYGANTPAGVNMALDSSGLPVSTLPGADMTAAALPISAGGSGFTNITPTRSFNPLSWRSPSTINPALGPFFYDRRYLGGPIRKYASGGYISGKSGIDQIPAMLSEGEYVIRASSARQLGKPMLDRINAGKFNEGGAVSELMGSSETGSSGGNTNNINISINMERGSSSRQESQSQDNSGQNPADRSSDEEGSAALAERIKQQVVSVIIEEQRPGGLLSE